MEKKTSKASQKTTLGLRKETLRQLDDSQMQAVAGALRIRIPVGFAPDTTPIYEDVAG
jgi:hypothetical protein